MAGKSESHGELVKSEISVMPFEQTTLVAGSQMRNMATMLDMEREINSQREQLIRVTYTMDRQVARLSREIELLQERQASNPEANWRVREDIEALSRRLDALEAFCRSEAEAKAEAKAEVDNGPQSASLQAQILAIREEIRALSAECHLEQTRDVAGVRARAAVEQMAAKQRAEMEKLHCQIADLQRSMSSQDNTPTSSQGESSQSMQHLLGSVEPVLRAALEQQLGRIVADLRGDTAARCAELRAEVLGRLDAVEGGPQGSGPLRRRPGHRAQTLASVSEHQTQASAQSPSPARPRQISQDSSTTATESGRSKEAAVHELDAAVDRLVSKVNLALEGSIGHAAAGSLQESTDALKKCLKDLSCDGKVLQRSMSAIERPGTGGHATNPHGPHPHAVRVGSPDSRFRSASPPQAQPRFPSGQFRGYTQSLTAPAPQVAQYSRGCPTQPVLPVAGPGHAQSARRP